MPPDALARHDWVWLAENWVELLRADMAAEALLEAQRRVALDLPFVVAGPFPTDRPEDLRLGLALPDKRRIGLHVGRHAVTRSAPPPTLRDVLVHAPTRWRPLLVTVDDTVAAAGLSAAVYGSLAWQARSGTAYVRAGSDVDLLLRASGTTSVGACLSLVDTLSAFEWPPRLDGEIVLPTGEATAWREFARRPEELLVKGPAGPVLRTRGAIEALFAGSPT